jgi:hypothetical protein
MVKRIFMRLVLDEMKKTDSKGDAVPFSIEFRTYNRHNKMGGVLKTYEGAKLLMAKKTKEKSFNPISLYNREELQRKNPNHWQNRTRNIELPSGQIKKLNILYITKFNDLEVIY